MRMMPTDFAARHLIIDGGKSKTDAIVIDSAGRVLARSQGAGLEIIGSPNGPERVVASLRDTLSRLDFLDSPIHTVCFDLNGVQAPSQGALIALASVRGLTEARRYVVASDVIMTYVGALGFAPGVVVAAGTGAVTLAVGKENSFHRVDAYGPLLGDRGSGYDVGRRGLVNAFQVADGLAGSPVLYEQMRQRFGGVDPAMAAVYGDINPSKVIASFSKNVAAAAEAGDADSMAIWIGAGRALARGVAAAAIQAELHETAFDVALAGGLFGAGRILRDPFERELRLIEPRAHIQPAAGGALDGGRVFALEESPVWTEVSTWVTA